ncbi:MAG TPA: tetratricopeptide repeat protein [Casimicrobiaceae bacterium]|nr:tetratricopeptide repeat protein [Casimicrobiaceae bacterium]
MANDLEALLREASERVAARDRNGAIAAYRSALELAPERAELHHNLGVMLAEKHRDAEALRSFAAAAQRRPDWPEPWLASGHMLFARGRYKEAAGAFEAALARAPERLDASYNAAKALVHAKRWSLAVPHLVRARALAPANEDVWFELRALFLRLGRLEEAAEDTARFEASGAPSARLAVAALAARLRGGDAVAEAAALERALDWPYAEGDEALVAELLALLQYVDLAQERLFSVYRTYDRLQQAGLRGAASLARPRRDDDPVLRIGYLSADFRDHVMGKLLLPVVAAHDRARFAVRAYALAPPENSDALTARWKAAVDEFVNVAALDDRAAAEAIAADDLDLLVDLMGHSSYARPGILAYKPARTIVTHLGYHGAIGLSQVDYKLTDRYADTAATARWQIEALLPMDTCVLPLRRVAPAPDAGLSRQGVGLPSEAPVFATFVSVQKLSPRCIAAWRRILDALPGAVLAFSPVNDEERRAIERRATGLGLEASRLAFVPYRRGDDAYNRARYALVDVALDTMPYTGGDTTAAALDGGVPVVTRVGSRHAERMGYSILMHLGLTQTIAHTDDGYVELALRLATDGPLRDAVRAEVARAMADPAATDPLRYARALEAAYERAIAERNPSGAR